MLILCFLLHIIIIIYKLKHTLILSLITSAFIILFLIILKQLCLPISATQKRAGYQLISLRLYESLTTSSLLQPKTYWALNQTFFWVPGRAVALNIVLDMKSKPLLQGLKSTACPCSYIKKKLRFPLPQLSGQAIDLIAFPQWRRGLSFFLFFTLVPNTKNKKKYKPLLVFFFIFFY